MRPASHHQTVWPSKQPLMVSTFLKVYMELGSYFLFLQEQIKDIIIIRGAWALRECTCPPYKCLHACECIPGNDCEASSNRQTQNTSGVRQAEEWR